MSRLKHSRGGYIRSLQISRCAVFAFVEGIEADPYFYGEICRRVSEGRGGAYQVRPARELPDGAEGKNAIVQFYRYARSKAKLISELGGKRTIMVFFLDKDLDDIKRKKCRSQHVIYTAYYDVQNHIFRHSDFGRATSAALSIDRTELLAHPVFAGDWCRNAAERWREWIALCILSVKYAIPSPHYRVSSQVNRPINGPLDPAQYATAVQRAATHLGVTTAEINRRLTDLLKAVDKHLSHGTYDLVFKGKWYATLLEADLREAFAGRALQFNGVGGRVVSVMAATMDYSQTWAEPFLRSLGDLVALL
jgi:hypothetical protein